MEYNVSYRTKNKSIQCVISYKDNDGKWKQKTKQGFKTQKESKPWIKATVEELEKTIKTTEEFRGITLGEFKKVFLNDKKRSYSYNALLVYENAFKKFEELDCTPLIELAYINIKPCVDAMIDAGLKPSTIKDYLSRFKILLNHAVYKYDILTTNPVRDRDYSFEQEKKKKINALNKSQADYLLNNLNGTDYYICLIALKCGLRAGEIIGLTDLSFNFKEGIITIDKQWKKLGNKEHGFGKLKSKNSYRDVPIPSAYVSQLKKYVRSCVIGTDRRIFLDVTTGTTVNRIKNKMNRLGFDASIHDLRHTYATTLLANGFDYKTVAELMGDNVQTIIKTYSHFTKDMFDSAKKRIDNIL